MLNDGSEGIGTPYFDTYFEDSYDIKMIFLPTDNPDEV